MGLWFWIWLVLAAVLIVGEIFTMGFFLLWFGVGSALAAILALIGAPLWLQWVVFVASSGILLAVTRRFAQRVTRDTPSGIGPDRLIGKRARVTAPIDPQAGTGMVRVERDDWRATPEDDQSIPQGEYVRVVRIDGTHLIVRPDAAPEN